MKNSFRVIRSYFLANSTPSAIRLTRCQTDRCWSSAGNRAPTEDENYFINLSNVLHRVKDGQLPVNKISQPRTDLTEDLDAKEAILDRQELFQFDDVEEDHFDSLAEKDIKFEDVPKITTPSFNLAAYANKSETLQELVKLGVDVYRWEKMKDVPDLVTKLDFENDVKKYIRFLHDVGVPHDCLGTYLTKNPMIFKQNIDDLKVRVNYLESKKFSPEAIGRIVTKAPHFLLFSTQAIDRRLGYLQKEYKLKGDEVRAVITRCPKLAIWNFIKIRDKYFTLKEEMGFSLEEIKTLMFTKPKIWLLEPRSLLERFNYLHLTMEIPHNLIIGFPGCLTRRRNEMKQRHLFLVALNRAQYDPTKECYVSLKDLSSGTDFEFCNLVAKTSIKKFNEFLKTL